MFYVKKHNSRRSNAAFKKDAVNAPSIAPAPVQPALTAEQLEGILRKFDLNPRFGPFVGIDRLDRWERAERFGLNPHLQFANYSPAVVPFHNAMEVCCGDSIDNIAIE